MSAIYDGLEFETSLLARWACFFDLAGWRWARGPVAIEEWKPDFRVTFECGHSECSGSHTILVSILAVDRIDSVQGHPALAHRYFVKDSKGAHLADAGAVFGSNPSATQWEMSHGAGGGIESVLGWVREANSLWAKASAKVTVPAN